jgi:uncharacterized repeat protein (TIGR03803 family)
VNLGAPWTDSIFRLGELVLTICSIRSLANCVLLVAIVILCISIASLAHAANLITLASFNGPNGRQPIAGLIADAGGNLYGTTETGGASDSGTVFKIDAATGALTTLASFNDANGVSPYGDLISDAGGNMYGTTGGGGPGGRGTVFKLTPATGSVTTVASFNGANGSLPRAGLIAGVDGNLYGTTQHGGVSEFGTVFKLDPATGILTTVALFNGFTHGHWPRASLIADANGNLYGTSDGGASSRGMIFKLDATTGALATLASFDDASGRSPLAGLIADADGNLYGTTEAGGANNFGTIFKVDPATGALATLTSFDGANGSYPSAGLIADAAGNLYGTTQYGGANGRGTVFKLDPATGHLNALASFNDANGSVPFAGLIADADGNLYGTTGYGGTHNYGTVFKLTDTGFVVPEPASLSLVALGTAAMVRRRRA